MTSGWEQRTRCIAPQLAGKPAALEVYADGGSGTCANGYTQIDWKLDDFELGQNLACPHQ